MSSPSAPRGAATQSVADCTIEWDGTENFQALHVGQTVTRVVTVKKADGQPWTGKEVNITKKDTENTIMVSPKETVTDDEGRLEVNITAVEEPQRQIETLITAKVGNVAADLGVGVRGIDIEILNPQNGAVIGLGGGTFIRARVVDDTTGQPVDGVRVSASKHAGPGPLTVTPRGGGQISGMWQGEPGIVYFDISVPDKENGGIAGNYEVAVSPLINAEDNTEILRITVLE